MRKYRGVRGYMDKLLIMGANPETVSLIEKAKELGYYTIVADYDSDAYNS